MTKHTPDIVKAIDEVFVITLGKHIASALRFCDSAEDTEISVYHNQNHDIVERLTKGWLSCKGDSSESYERALCYSNLNLTYDCNHFNEIAELHYESMKLYWESMVSYIRKSLSGLI